MTVKAAEQITPNTAAEYRGGVVQSPLRLAEQSVAGSALEMKTGTATGTEQRGFVRSVHEYFDTLEGPLTVR